MSKDNQPNVWFSHNGERLGTFDGHDGAVWDLDVSSAYPKSFVLFVCCLCLPLRLFGVFVCWEGLESRFSPVELSKSTTRSLTS